MTNKALRLLLLLGTNSCIVVNAIQDTVLSVTLPKPLSDLTATLVGTKVYLAGGCDSPNGNTYDTDADMFLCGSVSQAFYAFDVETQTLGTSLAQMPTARYRHAAAAAKNKIWIHGGRDLDDNVVTQIDVYDIGTNTWTTYDDNVYNYSDHTGFSYQNYAYFVGGYLPDYVAVKTNFRIDADATTATDLVMQEMAPMTVERGDIHSTTFTDDAADNDKMYALVGGGFTHVNEWCEPHTHAERYDFTANTWTDIANMTFGGAERVLVSVVEEEAETASPATATDSGNTSTTKVFAIGGERQVNGYCQLKVKPLPGERTLPLDKVERYQMSQNAWVTLASLPDYRFRFAAVGYQDLVISFGGQKAYQESCKCFAASNEIVLYQELGTSGADVATALGGGGSMVLLFSAMTAAFLSLMI